MDVISDFDQRFAAAVMLHQAGRLTDAKMAYLTLIEADPQQPQPYNNLGLIVEQEGAPQVADQLYKKALSLDNGNLEALNNLGNLYKNFGQYAEAVMYFEAALSLDQRYLVARANLAMTLQAAGSMEAAAEHYRLALEIDPALAETHNGLGHLLLELGDQPRASHHFILATLLRPDWAGGWNNLGTSRRRAGHLEASRRCLVRALTIAPDFPDALLNLGNIMNSLGRARESIACYERILERYPDHPGSISNLLFALNYADGIEPAAIAARHRELAARIEGRAGNPPRPDRRPKGKLRVGYVSPDFRTHSVAYFFEPLLREHDRDKVEIFCYAQLFAPDATSERLAQLADHWVPTLGMNDDAMAARIAADRIDILVDLAGHSGHNRLAVFARRPAPVQVTWLGYPNTTGLVSIDFRLVDEVSDPAPQADTLASEKLIRLEGGFHCYQAPADTPDVAPPPCLANGFVTFGSFNNIAKSSDRALGAWGAILDAVQGSRLAIKSRFFGDPAVVDYMQERLRKSGIEPDRVMLQEGIAETRNHLAAYGGIDITLDSFPYNGTTTLCESLWMGVPVVALRGDSHLSRVGASLLTHAGHSDLIAETVEDYVARAAALAMDKDRLGRLRRELRLRFAASPLCDAAGFARKIEKAYEDMINPGRRP